MATAVTLKEVRPPARRFASLKGVIEDELYVETMEAASLVRGLSITYLNSNQNRGGVFEHLWSLVPLMNDLGVRARWYAASEVPPDFYDATRVLYNGLQGAGIEPDEEQWALYEDLNAGIGEQVRGLGGDAVLVQDHQFAASAAHTKPGPSLIWQSHSDTQFPNPKVASRFERYLDSYDAILFYCESYLFGVLDQSKVRYSTIAIDPTSDKNRWMPISEAQERTSAFGFDPTRPLLVQVARIDTWKDFPGVAQAWLQVRARVPHTQLALVGSTTPNNVRAAGIIAEVQDLLDGSPDAKFLVNRVEPRSVKAFQTAASVVIQNSRREGFGLTVSEALWSGTPVVGRDVGGISLQVSDGECGFLYDSIEQCSDRVVELLQRRDFADALGRVGHERVRRDFVLPRLIRDELRLFRDVVGNQ